jgi:dephospho-CoA kinase
VIIGLTGSIASGKSTSLKFFKKQGFFVWSADQIVHQLFKDKKVIEHFQGHFPEALEKDEVNRKILGEIVFNAPHRLKILESILHPLVNQNRLQFIKFLKRNRLSGVFEIPLLFETHQEKNFDCVIVVDIQKSLQKARALKRSSLTTTQFENILKNQMPPALKKKKADYIINANLSRAFMFREISSIVRHLTDKKKNARNYT